MVCPKCGSSNVISSTFSEQSLRVKKPGFAWWVLVVLWWVPLKWLLFTIPALVVKIFRPKNYALDSKTRTVFTCIDCGNTCEF